MRSKVTMVIAAASVFGAAVAAQAMYAPIQLPTAREAGAFDKDGPLNGRIVKVLELSEAQQKHIGALVAEQRELERLQWEELAALRKEMSELETAPRLDEQAARKLGAVLGMLETERILSRAKTRSRIAALLSPSQIALLERIRREPGIMSESAGTGNNGIPPEGDGQQCMP